MALALSVVKDVDLEAMPTSIFLNDDDDDDDDDDERERDSIDSVAKVILSEILICCNLMQS